MIRLRIWEGPNMITDSENLFQSTLKGGRLGVYCFSQEKITWSNLHYRCTGNYCSDFLVGMIIIILFVAESVDEKIWQGLPANLRSQVQLENIPYSVLID